MTIESKFKVGRYITLPTDFGRAPIAKPHQIGTMLPTVPQTFSVGPSTGFSLMPNYKRKATVQVGAGLAPHRDFDFLPWIAGAVSTAPLVRDMMTGPMSGCWLTTFMQNGQLHAAHIGTDTDQTKTDAANNAWNTFAIHNPNDVVGGFNPFRNWTGAYPKANSDEVASLKFFGVYGLNRSFWIICGYFVKVPGTNNATSEFRVAGVKKQQPVIDLNKLQHIDMYKT